MRMAQEGIFFFGVAPAPHRINDADEHIPEDVFSQVFVFLPETGWTCRVCPGCDAVRGLECIQVPIREQADS